VSEDTVQDAAALALSRRLEEPGWLAEWRRRAWAIYEESPLPIRADHLWRYTDPASFVPKGNPFEDEPAETRCPPELKALGVVCTDLAAAAREDPENLRRVMGTTVGAEHGKFEALNAAAYRSGLFLHVPKGLKLEEPVHLKHVLPRSGSTAFRTAVLIEEGASLTLIEELVGGAEQGSSQAYGVTEIRMGAGSRLLHATIQTLAKRADLFLTQRTSLERDATCFPVLASFGGASAKLDSGVILEGPGSESEMTGFVSGVGRQKFDHHTIHHHVGVHTRSNLDFKTVLSGRSRSAYTGLIRIEPRAAYTEAYQENRNLLLSPECRADSIPELEILNEEVQCKHGATVGPVDPNHLFYLMSRGIPEREAVVMIVEGHFEPALRRLPEAMQERLRDLVRERLKG
jgi:Fe-S cluster assembly protein SufD